MAGWKATRLAQEKGGAESPSSPPRRLRRWCDETGSESDASNTEDTGTGHMQAVKEEPDDSEDPPHALKRSLSRTPRRWQHCGHTSWQPKEINVDEL